MVSQTQLVATDRAAGDSDVGHAQMIISSATKMCRREEEEEEQEPSSSPVIYKPSKWSHEYIQTLKINHPNEVDKRKMKLIEENVRNQLISSENEDVTEKGDCQLTKLELIDDMLKLGIGHRFQTDITRELERMSTLLENSVSTKADDLYMTALRFRLLRQNGLKTSQDVFQCHLGKNGRFKQTLSNDVQGLLALYEASYLACDGEEILNMARAFSAFHLKNHLKRNNLDKSLEEQIIRALELPLHRRVQKLEARWYIEEHYRAKMDRDLQLLELAKLDYNFVQTTLQCDLQELSRWWKETGLAEKLSFARDRLMECFFWATGMVSEPQYSKCRKELTKLGIFITIIDDVYDVYGSLDELELFTEAVQRWDIFRIDDLPDYMKPLFLALYNTTNEMAYSNNLIERGLNIIPLLAKAWADLCSAFLVEARWSYGNQMPSFNEYMENGWLSVSGPLILVHAYCLSQPVTSKAMESFQDIQNFMLWPSVIFRLCNDLATSSAELARGESVSSVQCYMQDTGVSEADASCQMRNLIERSWHRMNCLMAEDRSVLGKSFVDIVMNLGRIVHCVYQHGDGHGSPDKTSRNRVLSLIVNPIT